jgi:hypothetical protein
MPGRTEPGSKKRPLALVAFGIGVAAEEHEQPRPETQGVLDLQGAGDQRFLL